MNPSRVRLLATLAVAVLVWAWLPALNSASNCGAEDSGLTPDNTVILSNETDASFCRDFSVLLKRVRLEWIVLDSAEMPESARDKNLIIIGQPDAEYVGDIIKKVITQEQADYARQDGHFSVHVRDSPWTDGTIVHVCTGADQLLTKRAAEEAFSSLAKTAESPERWMFLPFTSASQEDGRAYVARLQYEWHDEELPVEAMVIDLDAKPPKRMSAQEAAEDVERLFYVFSHGYAGYGFFNMRGDFEKAKQDILRELETEADWNIEDFSQMLREHLGFIRDRHTKVGGIQYGGHEDFWYDTTLELWKEKGTYRFISDGTEYAVASINGGKPEPFMFPSLNARGQPIYRLGVLSPSAPEPLALAAEGGGGTRQLKIPLQRSDFGYYSNDIFREDTIGGIPVVRVRGFGDQAADELNQFLETGARYRGEPYLIVDIRGNGGGNEKWPIGWIAQFTGRRADSVFIFTELNSKTTLTGRANAMEYWLDVYPKTDTYRAEADRYKARADVFERGAQEPYWSGPYYPAIPAIPNDTTLIVVTNDWVASAGEGFVMRVSKVANVVLVGENTSGSLTFGNVSLHQLPHSKLQVWVPINLGMFLDLEFREEKGLAPDLWVPAADAVNYAVAAIRNGTITTRLDAPEGYLEQEFVPEDPWWRTKLAERRRLLVHGLFTVLAIVWAYFMRRKPRIVAPVGGVWLVLGVVSAVLRRPPTDGFHVLLGPGAVCLAWGLYGLWRARGALPTSPRG